ncbi:MAG TPA: M13 family metallopeptidase [Verrucomicrobiae bacterium]|jgi:predicted metalloendopeptidase
MNFFNFTKRALTGTIVVGAAAVSAEPLAPVGPEPPVPAFSTSYMDKSASPAADFYEFAEGQWVKDNPVPADKARWASFTQLAERNSFLIHQLLEDAAAAHASKGTPLREAGDFYASAMNTNRLEKLRFKPIAADLKSIDRLKSTDDLFRLLARFHQEGLGAIFRANVGPDARDSSIYAFGLDQGGLSLPDRDYYLKDSFATQRAAYREHAARMLTLLGESGDQAAHEADIVLDVETSLAKASRTRVELRDPNKNYNKMTKAELLAKNPAIPWQVYFDERSVPDVPYAIVGQPEFLDAVNTLITSRPLSDWKVYLRWHVLHGAAPYLCRDAEAEDFNFFGKVLSGQQEQEPRWKRAFHTLDRQIGEAVGQLYVEKCFPPEAKARMNDLVNNLKAVFRDHLEKVSWMSDETRAKALAKFARFTQKIGYPDKFRDYSSVKITRDDYLGNIRRAAAFEEHRELARVGQKVDRTEWDMTPPTVNAYFNPVQNEIAFPAGILQPPFFDVSMDDAVNYGGIGVVIGHEITHGYDDEGRKYDADGNLNEWWTEADGKEFDARAQKVVDEYGAFETLPGLHVNGKLTLGENLADLGGVTIAYDAMERKLAADPSKRKTIGGFTPEQRFFISFAQIWRTNIRDAEAKRLVTVDPHSPGRFRAVGPLVNFQPFFDAFNIKPGDPMWRAPELRAQIW